MMVNRLILHLQFQHPIWMQVHVLDAPFVIQFPAYGPGRQWRMANSLGPYTHMGDSEEALSFQLQLCSDHYGHVGNETSPYLSFLLCEICLSNKNR